MKYTDIVATINKLVKANEYLCVVEKQDDGSHLLKYAQDYSDGYSSAVYYWVGRWNRRIFDKINLAPGTPLKIKELDDEDRQQLIRIWEDLQLIKKDALQRIENDFLYKNKRR